MSNFFILFSAIYRGTGPFSEPETAAVRDFINAQKQNQEFLVINISNKILFSEYMNTE